MEVLVVEHPQDVNSRSFDKKPTLLLLALQGPCGSRTEHGADAAAQAEDGQTPLHCVFQEGHVVLSRLLLEYGADM